MTDIILRAPDQATINAGFQALGAWRDAVTTTENVQDALLGTYKGEPSVDVVAKAEATNQSVISTFDANDVEIGYEIWSTKKVSKTTPAGPILQGVQKDGQQWFVVIQGTVMVPQRNPAGWTSSQSKDAFGNPVTTWKPNGAVVMTKNAMGGQSPAMQPYDKGYYVVLRWLGDNPPAIPKTVTLIDRNTLNPDFMAGIPAIA